MFQEDILSYQKVLESAITFAIRKHKGQTRKGDGRPYIMHPISVMLILNSIKDSKNMLMLSCCAILHDVVEDTRTTIKEIAEHFGYHIAGIVEELTSDKKAIDFYGKKEYLRDKMNSMSSYALVIKLCDRLDNLRDMDSMTQEFRDRTISDTKYILDNLNRNLTLTHKKLIRLIRKEIRKYGSN